MYFVVEISKTKNSDKFTKAVYEYNSQMEAVGTFHQKLGGAMKNEDYISDMLTVIDERGATIAHDYYLREIELPEENQADDLEEKEGE